MLLALPLFRIQIQRLPSLLLPPYYPSHRWLSSPSHHWLSSPKLVPQLPSMPPYSLFSRELQRGPHAQVLLLYVTQSSCANDCSLTCSIPLLPPPSSSRSGSTDAPTRQSPTPGPLHRRLLRDDLTSFKVFLTFHPKQRVCIL